jgi:hypothetical protein
MRTYYRASGGVDGAIQTLLFWAVMLTAPIWIPALLIFGAWTYFTADKKPPEPVPAESYLCEIYRAGEARTRKTYPKLNAEYRAKYAEIGCKP